MSSQDTPHKNNTQATKNPEVIISDLKNAPTFLNSTYKKYKLQPLKKLQKNQPILTQNIPQNQIKSSPLYMSMKVQLQAGETFHKREVKALQQKKLQNMSKLHQINCTISKQQQQIRILKQTIQKIDKETQEEEKLNNNLQQEITMLQEMAELNPYGQQGQQQEMQNVIYKFLQFKGESPYGGPALQKQQEKVEQKAPVKMQQVE